MKSMAFKWLLPFLFLFTSTFPTSFAQTTDTLTLGGETFQFPQNSLLTLLFTDPNTTSSADVSSQSDRSDFIQFGQTIGSLADSSNSTLYQVVTPTPEGIQTAFVTTLQISSKQFKPTLWGALFPGFPPDTFLHQYLDQLQREVAPNQPYLMDPLGSPSLGGVFLHSLSPSETLVNSQNELVQTQDFVATVHTSNVTIPLSGRYYSWQYKDDFYMVFLLSVAGERRYWESFPKPYQTNFKPLVQ